MCAMPVPFYWFTLRDPQTYRFKSVRIADGYATSSASVHERRRSQGANREEFPPGIPPVELSTNQFGVPEGTVKSGILCPE